MRTGRSLTRDDQVLQHRFGGPLFRRQIVRIEKMEKQTEQSNCTEEKGKMRSKEERIEMGKAAQAELDRLMKSHPEAREAQKEIRDRLMRAGTRENRMGVLGIMIEGKLSDLQQQL